jgi:hypothetical protein
MMKRFDKGVLRGFFSFRSVLQNFQRYGICVSFIAINQFCIQVLFTCKDPVDNPQVGIVCHDGPWTLVFGFKLRGFR